MMSLCTCFTKKCTCAQSQKYQVEGYAHATAHVQKEGVMTQLCTRFTKKGTCAHSQKCPVEGCVHLTAHVQKGKSCAKLHVKYIPL